MKKTPSANPKKKPLYLPIKLFPLIFVLSLILVYAAVFVTNAFTSGLEDWANGLPIAIRYILATVFVAGFVGAFYVLFILAYLSVKRRKPGGVFVIELVTFLLAFVLSWILKVVVLVNEVGFVHDFNSISQAILSAFYAALGGLQFEGLATECTLGTLFAICCYYGTSIIAAFVFISVIASRAAMSFYSFLLLLFLKTKDKEIFTFTALNDETLNIASSIAESDRDTSRRLIIFSGPALQPFDRHDPHCVEVMAHGYIYWPFPASEKSNILAKLHLTRAKAASISVFAFDSDDDHIPHEEENMDYVLMDIHNRIEAMAKKAQKAIVFGKNMCDLPPESSSLDGTAAALHAQAKNLECFYGDESVPYSQRKISRLSHMQKRGLDVRHVSYYILTKRFVDYQAYQDKIASLEKEYEEVFRLADEITLSKYLLCREADRTGNPDAKKLRKAYEAAWRANMPFSVHVWNEADAIAFEATRYLNGGLTRNVPSRKQTWVCSFGFGTTGQTVAKALYTAASNVDDQGKAAAFLCDVFDPNGISSIAGLFGLEVPMAVVLSDVEDRDDVLRLYEERADAIANGIAAGYPESAPNLVKDIRKEMAFPCFVFHDYGTNDLRATQALGALSKEKGFFDFSQGYPDYIVIAAGDDYANIRIANAFSAYLLRREVPTPVTLFVNVWDEKNNNLVNGFNRGKPLPNGRMPQVVEFGKNVRIIIVGNNADIYDCDNILDAHAAMNYNRVYDSVASASNNEANRAFNHACHEFYLGKKPKEIPLPMEALKASDGVVSWDGLDESIRDRAVSSWNNLSLWKRVSSSSAVGYGPVFRRMIRGWKEEEDQGEFFAKLVLVEHQRWMRTHMMDGWTYAAKRDDALRRHGCLLPLAYIPEDLIVYDLFNVFLGRVR